ncbi:MAG TPA: 3-oxoacyl-[acyl-carrier-protein] synthase III C-terminal domain-containing protein [Methylophilaceae bacterium]|jgi:alkylresorcinol/alkylpyrone synthase
MHVNGIGTATPLQRYSKAECLEAFKASAWYARLGIRARAIVEAVLSHDNGIGMRYLAVDRLEEVFEIDPDTLHKRFLANAPGLARAAGRKALSEARLDASEIDAVIVSTCTGYLCPGLSGYAIEQLQLRPDILAFDLVGQGCAGALPNWQLGDALLASGKCQHVLSICVEVCSAAMYLDDDAGILISACLFGDGAGAAVLSTQPATHKRSVEFTGSGSLINPQQRTALMFEQRQGMLRNILTRRVPRLAAEHVRKVTETLLKNNGVTRAKISNWIMHAGGRDVLLALENELGIEAEDFRYSASILYNYGNLSSAFVYFVLQAALADGAEGGWWMMSSFGAGFSCHAALLKVD